MSTVIHTTHNPAALAGKGAIVATMRKEGKRRQFTMPLDTTINMAGNHGRAAARLASRTLTGFADNPRRIKGTTYIKEPTGFSFDVPD